MVNTAGQPLIEEFRPVSSPLHTFAIIENEPFSFFLDSGMDAGKLGRYSFMGSDPFLEFSSRGQEITIRRGVETELLSGHPFDMLGELLDRYRLDGDGCPVPFTGGAVGYLSYDLGRFVERLPARAADDLHLPESYFGFYDVILAFDNLENLAYIVSTGWPETDGEARRRRAKQRLEAFRAKLAAGTGEAVIPAITTARPAPLVSGFTREEYMAAVEKARQYIIDGDIFEVNLSQRFETDLKMPPFELYRRLRELNPAPFAAYLNFGAATIVSASPERFLRLRGDTVQTRPIKGTRPRGKTPAEDERLAAELASSVKDRAENMMIVDLERNDLGRVCRYGTVKVTELAVLETFPTVFHLTSTVEGRLRADAGRIDLLKATFPGGSITGAPKVRAMEIIEELEPTRRSVYTGGIGYLSFSGDMDLNIVIRTFIIKDGRAYFQVGGAVVYDSDPAAEYQETLDKAYALINALNTGGVGEA
jgi:para-aminobenzoate synthetase component 1